MDGACQTPRVFVGMTAAMLAAVLFGVIAVVQAAVIRKHGLFSPLMAWVLLAYLIGWLLHLVAIDYLPLYLAQVGLSASLVVTVLVAASIMREPLRVEHWVAVVGLMAGLVVLAVASGSVGDIRFTATTTVVLYAFLALNTLLGWLAYRWQAPASGVLLSVLAGTAYGATPVATRVLTERPLEMTALLPAVSIGLYGALGFVLYSVAMKRTSVTAATAPLNLLQAVIPAVVGVVTFGDHVRPGWWPLAAAAFGVSLVSSVVLCTAEARLEILDTDGLSPAELDQAS